MSMREEVKEAMAKAAVAGGCPALASDIRAEQTLHGLRLVAEEMARAALSVIDQYEEVEVKEHATMEDGERLFRDSGSADLWPDCFPGPTLTIFVKKQEPVPGLKELGLQLCEALDSVLVTECGEIRRCAAAFKKAAKA